ncbi:MAG: A/G-specific adenine glycosylase [Thermoplasmata archaeon]|nr:A/G-specific adenine glycosylase [Thermoplasmata archaeon]
MTARAVNGSVEPAPAPSAAALLRWYEREHRPLPWRTDRDPYRIWIAEVLLQQTRVAQAIPYYERFVTRYPDVTALARASEEEVLKVWEGAGYYARARNLRRAAVEVVDRFAGRVPASVAELRGLPGIGPYIASAVASLAFNAPVLALEANGLRVGARLSLERGDVRARAPRQRIAKALARSLPVTDAGAFNEALMELGETICTPVRPACPRCPWASTCRARQELPDPSVLPRRSHRPKSQRVVASVVAVRRRGRWLVQRRPSTGLLGGLWELPGGKQEPGELPEDTARRELREETGLTVGSLRLAGVVRHSYTHFQVELHVFVVETPSGLGPISIGPNARWVTDAGFERLARPRATEKAMALVRRLLRGK